MDSGITQDTWERFYNDAVYHAVVTLVGLILWYAFHPDQITPYTFRIGEPLWARFQALPPLNSNTPLNDTLLAIA